jgi:hypothetical protein
LAAAQEAETRIGDGEYDKHYAAAVRATEAAEKKLKDDPAAALAMLQEQVLGKLPPKTELVLSVRYTRGATNGAEKERHAFFPYRLAGQAALAADRPDLAVTYLEKSPTSAELLAKARAALAEKSNKPAPKPEPKPGLDLSALLAAHDYVGALKRLEAERPKLGKEYDARAKEVRQAAAAHAALQAAEVSKVLPRLTEENFLKEYVQPRLEACRGVPADLEPAELRWVRSLAEWIGSPDPALLDKLALEAARFDPDFHFVCRKAQEDRVREVERLAGQALEAARADRPAVLAKLEAAERAFRSLAAAKAYPELADALKAHKEKLPIDDEALDRARAGAGGVAALRVLADELDRLWTSERRARLSVQDRNDLAAYVGITRAAVLFLDGKSTDEVAKDPRVVEAFRAAPALPPDVSPKIAAVRQKIK